MNPKIYLFLTSAIPTPFVELVDWQELKKKYDLLDSERLFLNDYCDRLVADLPCLPQDLENLRAANTQFAQDNHELLKLAEGLNKENDELTTLLEDATQRADVLVDQLWQKHKEIKALENKWKIAVEIAAIAENKLKEALKKLDKIEEIL